MARKSEFRRSCALCRSRKIACSGERICTACRDRSIECVYDLEIAKGRPRTNKTSSSSRASTASATLEESESGDGGLPESMTSSSSVAGELDAMFRENFGGEPIVAPSNIFQVRVATFNQHLVAGKASRESPTPAGSLSYSGFLALVTQELIETVVGKLGGLGSHAFFGQGERFYRACMLQDTSKTMFGTPGPTPASSPCAGLDIMAEYGSHMITQHLEVWFSHHPLSILVSKALLLRDLRNQTAHRVLLAVLLADAHHFADDPLKGDRMLNWAVSQLHTIPVDQADMTTAHITLLLGWYHACRGHSRRALCYIGYTGRIMAKLKVKLQKSPLTGQTHINGIDRGAVEAELIHNTWWVMLALTVWAFIQMNMPVTDLLPASLMQVDLASTETESMLLQLDRATYNLSTLRSQLSSLKSVWLLAHLTLLAAHLYALYQPPTPRSPPQGQHSRPWQDLVLHRLNCLLSQGRSLVQVCADSRAAIKDVISLLQLEQVEGKGGLALLTVYHAVSIHLLFPCEEGTPDRNTLVLTYQVFQELARSMHDLQAIFQTVQTWARPDSSRPASTAAASLHFFILALDATSRALMQILTVLDRCPRAEQQRWIECLLPLFEGGSTLHGLFDHDILLQDHRWRLVKRQLKMACKRLEGFLGSSRDQFSRPLSSLELNVAPSPPEGGIGGVFFSNAIHDPIPSSSSLSQEPLRWPDWHPVTQGQLRDSHSKSVSDFDLTYLTPTGGSLDSLASADETSHLMQQMPQHPTSLTSFWSGLNLSPSNTLVEMVPSPSSLSPAGFVMTDHRGQSKRSLDNLWLLDGVDHSVSTPNMNLAKRLKGDLTDQTTS
ncbi:hypothetical protein EYZ11_007022 [Aspergillus tanneri]|uniref:Zn(2)-C6 fungal-type domain-containing protein n=1 Tax=Aspergillus tanneri TaxID=1220188 RepID=A0A4S3JGE5_9EURO|nr:uncharacterized protein ATNIH1004_010723 [Aspergillus tanneri]KAA8641784.1 hypothetical protein ATNIH1004_010723 [Aspergillus tanneri]THC93498.1 hypothetical protein EYZ11_007022 [Aspergillus tanneri]